jgi:hypothetical protein
LFAKSLFDYHGEDCSGCSLCVWKLGIFEFENDVQGTSLPPGLGMKVLIRNIKKNAEVMGVKIPSFYVLLRYGSFTSEGGGSTQLRNADINLLLL